MTTRGRPPYPDKLTPREWEVLSLIREGLRDKEIAERLGITTRTAKYHVSEIIGKLGVTSRRQAAAWPGAPRESALAATLHSMRRSFRGAASSRPLRIGAALAAAAAIAAIAMIALGTLGGESEGEDLSLVPSEAATQAPTTTPISEATGTSAPLPTATAAPTAAPTPRAAPTPVPSVGELAFESLIQRSMTGGPCFESTLDWVSPVCADPMRVPVIQTEAEWEDFWPGEPVLNMDFNTQSLVIVVKFVGHGQTTMEIQRIESTGEILRVYAMWRDTGDNCPSTAAFELTFHAVRIQKVNLPAEMILETGKQAPCPTLSP